MLKGYNSDVTYKSVSYHIQTEDWGPQNPFLVSRIFRQGAVIKTVKVSYDEALRGQPIKTREALTLALRQQHSRVVEQVVEGGFLEVTMFGASRLD